MSRCMSICALFAALVAFTDSALTKEPEAIAWGAMGVAMLSLAWHFHNDADRRGKRQGDPHDRS